MHSAPRLVCLIALFATISLAARGKIIDLTTDPLTPEIYNPTRLLETANLLIAQGPQDTYASLIKYAETPFTEYSSVERNDRDDYVAWLCLLVYDPKPGSGLPEPGYGGGDFPDAGGRWSDDGWKNSAAWPRYPLALSHGVPFLLVSSYTLAGEAETGVSFVNRCQTYGVFHSTPYPLPTCVEAEAALNELISSPAWKALSWSGWYSPPNEDPRYPHQSRQINFLRLQVEAMKAADGKTLDLTADELTPQTYNPAQILITANKLIALGRVDAYASLRQYAKPSAGAKFPERINHDYYTAWLCLLIYDPKPGEGLPLPCFGGDQFPDIDVHRDGQFSSYSPTWPRFPLAQSNGVPFLVVFNYMLAGMSEPGLDYLKRCQSKGTFHITPYAVPTHDQARAALDVLVSSPQWKALPWGKFPHQMYGDMETPFLQGQVDRIKQRSWLSWLLGTE